MELNLFIEKLFEGAKAAGYEAAEIAYQKGDSFDVSVKGGEIVDYNVASTLDFTFRALVNGKMGYASTQVFDEDALDLLLESVKMNAGLIENEDERFIFEGSDHYETVDIYNPSIDGLTAAQKIEMAKELEKKAISLDPRAGQVEMANVFTMANEKRIANTRGLDVSRKGNAIGVSVAVIAQEGEKTATGGGFAIKRDPAQLDLDKLCRDAVADAVAGLSAKPVPSGEYRIVMRPDIMASMLACFSPVFSADYAQKGMSLLAGREGDVVASDQVTILDDPLMAEGLACSPFDGEGVATKTREVVSAGRLNTLLHNLKTAKKQGVETTGNASWGGAGVTPSNFYLKPGDLTRDEVYAQAGDGLLIIEVNGLHAGANQISGDFSLGAKGYVIRDGKVAEAVNQITVAGNFFQMLKDIEAVGSDLEMMQSIGAPTTLIKSLKVAG